MQLIVAALLLAGGRVSTLRALHRAHLLAILDEMRAKARSPPTQLQHFLRSTLDQGTRRKVSSGPNGVGGGPLQFQEQHLFVSHTPSSS
jgi:hypothetical protein